MNRQRIAIVVVCLGLATNAHLSAELPWNTYATHYALMPEITVIIGHDVGGYVMSTIIMS